MNWTAVTAGVSPTPPNPPAIPTGEGTTASRRFLTDRNNYLLVHRMGDGSAEFTRYGLANVPTKILKAICEAFDVEIVSEHQPQFWGFATKEEWDAAMQKIAAEGRDRFYDDVMHYVWRENHDLSPGTIGMIQADIAKVLIADHPDLALPESRERLLQAIESAYDRDHAVRVALTPKDLAVVRMYATHEDDLPKA